MLFYLGNLGRSSRKFEKKYGLHKLYKILEKQSGETQTFDTYFVFLEFLKKNKCWLMIQKVPCRNNWCILNIELYKKTHYYAYRFKVTPIFLLFNNFTPY